MRTLKLILIATVLSFTLNLNASNPTTTNTEETTACNSNSWFKYPKNNTAYLPGKPVYVRVDPQNHQHIAQMELYINGKFLRKESNYPYEWCKGHGNSDHYLRNLKSGTYKLTVKIKDRCGHYHQEHCTFHVTAPPTPGHSNCISDAWFKYPVNNNSYEAGKDVYVKVDVKKYQHIAFIELYVNGKLVRKETNYPYEWCKGSGNSDGYLRNLKSGTYKITAKIKDKCGQYHQKHCTIYVKGHNNGGGHQAQCDYKGWFKYPQNDKNYNAGSNVYVYFDAQNYKNISYTELYVNGKLVRKETTYPYEWCKGSGNSDAYLRNLKAGTYKLKCRVYDKCGKYKDYFCTFYVKGGNNDGGGNAVCDYKGWFKYPQNGKSYNAGSNVYVYFDAQNYKNISYTELYVNGKLVRKETTYPYEWCKGTGSSDGYLRNLKVGTYKLKCRVYDKCGKYKDYFCTFYVKGGNNDGGGNTQACKYKSWFKYPKNNGTYRYGDDVYVRVDTEKYQDIAEMQLYVNGKFVRKETTYPYEWCKGSGNSDSYLRNLKRGTYNLKCRVKTKCGDWYEYYCKFYVR